MIKLRRLKVNRFRNVRPGCEMRFGDGINVLLGPNGSGKSTLLEVISAAIQMRPVVGGENIDFEFEMTAESGSLRGRVWIPEKDDLANWPKGLPSPPKTNDSVYIDLVITPSILGSPQIELRFRDGLIHTNEIDTNGTPIEYKGATMGAIPILAWGQLATGGTPLLADQHAIRLDESLDTFRAITARSGTPLPPETEKQRPGVDDYLAKGRDGFQLGTGLLPACVHRAFKNRATATTTDVGIPQDELPFLARFVEMVGLGAATATLGLVERIVLASGANMTINRYGNLSFRFTRKDGSIFPDHQLSYGQKRLLAFLYYLEANPAFILADELVNGLHHAWIEECMKGIEGRQAFLTSQNPLLLDYLWFESVEQVQQSFVLCRTEQNGDREEMVWRNMTDDEAAMFFSAYQVGVEHVGEILRTRGLW